MALYQKPDSSASVFWFFLCGLSGRQCRWKAESRRRAHRHTGFNGSEVVRGPQVMDGKHAGLGMGSKSASQKPVVRGSPDPALFSTQSLRASTDNGDRTVNQTARIGRRAGGGIMAGGVSALNAPSFETLPGVPVG